MKKEWLVIAYDIGGAILREPVSYIVEAADGNSAVIKIQLRDIMEAEQLGWSVELLSDVRGR